MPAQPTVDLFGMRIDCVDLNTAARRLLEWCHNSGTGCCRYVVTPNVDHAVMFQSHAGLRKAYEAAAMVIADGAPLVWASRMLRQPLPERVAGSDLVPAVLELASTRPAPLRVFLLGAAPGVAHRAAQVIHGRWNNVEVVGTHSPPLGFESDPMENARIIDAISEAQPDLLIIGLGAPKQELWIAEHYQRLEAKSAICAGATIDFLAAEKQRSPVWMRRTGLEWVHRLASEPRRLAKRYARDVWVFPQLVWREWRGLCG
jgi:N-acetylglucosaminyldiphosphoundecaprenol N-acetyl-beta-D-mannosaminyltransferase